MPEAAVDLAPEALQQRVVDRDQQFSAWLAQPLRDQLGYPQPQFVD